MKNATVKYARTRLNRLSNLMGRKASMVLTYENPSVRWKDGSWYAAPTTTRAGVRGKR